MKWSAKDKDWWAANDGSLIRRVVFPMGTTRYVGWRPMMPVLFYFDTYQDAQRAVEKQNGAV